MQHDTLGDLHTPEIGEWGKEKYALMHKYVQMFSRALKKSWKHRVYVDLYAGAGRAKIKNTDEVIDTCALKIFDVNVPFTKYIFSDISAKNIHALKVRVDEIAPNADSTFICGDTNLVVEDIIRSMPSFNRNERCIGFCLVDIFKLENLHFSTIEKLSKRFFDFLVLIPTGMEIRRNIENVLVDNECNVIDDFLDCKIWRDKWDEAKKNGIKPDIFISECFGKKMESLGYKKTDLDTDSLRITNSKNRIIYHLFFYSRHELGKKFFKEAKKASVQQLDLFLNN